MLPKARRLRRPADFTRVFRAGVRAGTPSVVVHVRRITDQEPPETTRVGLAVSKQVGNAVVRNRVKRRLRHLLQDLSMSYGADVVVRAMPAAASEPDRLAEDLTSAWRRAERKAAAC